MILTLSLINLIARSISGTCSDLLAGLTRTPVLSIYDFIAYIPDSPSHRIAFTLNVCNEYIEIVSSIAFCSSLADLSNRYLTEINCNLLLTETKNGKPSTNIISADKVISPDISRSIDSIVTWSGFFRVVRPFITAGSVP